MKVCLALARALARNAPLCRQKLVAAVAKHLAAGNTEAADELGRFLDQNAYGEACVRAAQLRRKPTEQAIARSSHAASSRCAMLRTGCKASVGAADLHAATPRLPGDGSFVDRSAYGEACLRAARLRREPVEQAIARFIARCFVVLRDVASWCAGGGRR